MDFLNTLNVNKINSIYVPSVQDQLFRKLHMFKTYNRFVTYMTDADVDKGTIYHYELVQLSELKWYDCLDKVEYIPKPFCLMDIRITRYYADSCSSFQNQSEEWYAARFNEEEEKKYCFRVYIDSLTDTKLGLPVNTTFHMVNTKIPLKKFVRNTVLSYILFTNSASEIKYIE